MDAIKVDAEISQDVPNLGHGTALTAEEIAKAVAHHKKHHHDEVDSKAKADAGKKGKKGK